MAPLAEYTVSASYSSDRMRRARPKGSPRRLAVAKSVFGENNAKSLYRYFAYICAKLIFSLSLLPIGEKQKAASAFVANAACSILPFDL